MRDAPFALMLAPSFLLACFFSLAPAPAQAENILPDGCLGNLSENQVIVYYFHRKFRCQSCEVLEKTLMNMVQIHYADHFGSGRMAMCVVNLDDPENVHFLDQFQILSNSLVIVEKKDGNISRFKNLEDIWEVSEDSDAITGILRDEVSQFLPES